MMPKTYFILAGNHREYHHYAFEVAEQIQAKEGGEFKGQRGFGVTEYQSEHWCVRYLTNERRLYGMKNYRILNFGNWRDRHDIARIQAKYKHDVAAGDAE